MLGKAIMATCMEHLQCIRHMYNIIPIINLPSRLLKQKEVKEITENEQLINGSAFSHNYWTACF